MSLITTVRRGSHSACVRRGKAGRPRRTELMAETRNRVRGLLSSIRSVLGAAPGRWGSPICYSCSDAGRSLCRVGNDRRSASSTGDRGVPKFGRNNGGSRAGLRDHRQCTASKPDDSRVGPACRVGGGRNNYPYSANMGQPEFVSGLQQDLSMSIFGRALRRPYSWDVWVVEQKGAMQLPLDSGT